MHDLEIKAHKHPIYIDNTHEGFFMRTSPKTSGKDFNAFIKYYGDREEIKESSERIISDTLKFGREIAKVEYIKGKEASKYQKFYPIIIALLLHAVFSSYISLKAGYPINSTGVANVIGQFLGTLLPLAILASIISILISVILLLILRKKIKTNLIKYFGILFLIFSIILVYMSYSGAKYQDCIQRNLDGGNISECL